MRTSIPVSEGPSAFSTPWEPISSSQAEELVQRIYGLTTSAKRLSSERDDTFVLIDANGASFTLKIAHPLEDEAGLQFQSGAMLHLERAAPKVPVPRLVRTRDGENSYHLPQDDGSVRIVRLLTFLEGKLLSQAKRSIGQCYNIGAALAQLAQGLSSYDGTPPQGELLWDISHVLDNRSMLAFVGPARRDAVAIVLDDFETNIHPMAASFRRQIIHNDMNPHNILVHVDDPEELTGIIDFGDMVMAPLINDLAVAASYHLSTPGWMENLCALIEGYHAVTPLQDEEFLALPFLIKARLALTIMITEWRATQRPGERDYILRNHGVSWAGLTNLKGGIERDLASTLIKFCKDR